RAIGHRWVTPPLLWALWQAQVPLSAAELALVRPGHDQVGFVAGVLDQLVAAGGVERLGDGRYQLTPLAGTAIWRSWTTTSQIGMAATHDDELLRRVHRRRPAQLGRRRGLPGRRRARGGH